MSGNFPAYSSKERVADGLVLALGAAASVIAVAALTVIGVPTPDVLRSVALALYGLGLLAMFGFSAGYNMVDRPDWKGILRRFDHASIFLMIAGTYSPVLLIGVGGVWGHALLALVWTVALLGVGLKVFAHRRFERASVILCLALGWSIVSVMESLISGISSFALQMIFVGGMVYSVGVGFLVWHRLPYHNAIWHAFVLAAAGCHYAAVLDIAGLA